MNPFGDAVQQYMTNQRSATSSALGTRESIASSMANIEQAKVAADENVAGGEFADKLHEESNKYAADMAVDLGTAGVAPVILKAASRAAYSAAAPFNAAFKVRQARGFAESIGRNPDDAAPLEGSDMLGDIRRGADDLRVNLGGKVDNIIEQGKGALRDFAAKGKGIASSVEEQGSSLLNQGKGVASSLEEQGTSLLNQGKGIASSLESQGKGIASSFESQGQGMASKASSFLDKFRSSARAGQPPLDQEEFDDIEMVDPGSLGNVPAGSATKIGQIARNFNAGDTPGTSSVNIGRIINGAKNTTINSLKSQAQESLGDIKTQATNALEGTESSAAKQAVPGETQLQQDIMEADPEDHITGGTLAIKAQQDAARIQNQIKTTTEGVGEDLGEDVENFAPALSGIGDALGGIGSALGSFLPVVGWGLGAWTLVSGIEGAIKNAHDAAADPYAAIRGEMATAQGKINNLASNISADQFASKLGAMQPSFGSLAAAPTNDTSKQVNVALHV